MNWDRAALRASPNSISKQREKEHCMRKLLVLITGLAVAAAVALAVPGSASAAQYNVFQTEDGLCMGVQGGNMNPGRSRARRFLQLARPANPPGQSGLV